MKRHASAVWQGALVDGKGSLTSQSGALDSTAYSFDTRFKDESGKAGTNPEELMAAAHAGCFAMQLSHFLAGHGTPPEKLEAKAVVRLQEAAGGGFEITESALTLTGHVPGISDEDFQKLAQQAKENCPVSKAYGAIKVTLDARLA